MPLPRRERIPGGHVLRERAAADSENEQQGDDQDHFIHQTIL
jgi:hypothetical protein